MFDAYFNDIEDSYIDEHKIKFPCPVDGEYTTTEKCSSCNSCNRCDVYATMLDEVHDLTK